jgi:hypothetical protein
MNLDCKCNYVFMPAAARWSFMSTNELAKKQFIGALPIL